MSRVAASFNFCACWGVTLPVSKPSEIFCRLAWTSTKQSVDTGCIVLGRGSRSFGFRGALWSSLLLRGRRDYSKSKNNNDESEEPCIFHFVLFMSNNLRAEFSPEPSD